MVQKKLYRKIGEICREMNVRPHILRYWEDEFPMLRPRKNKTGQRIYSERDFEILTAIRQLLHVEKYTIAGARARIRELLRTPKPAEEEGNHEPAVPPPLPPPLPETPRRECLPFDAVPNAADSERIRNVFLRLGLVMDRIKSWPLDSDATAPPTPSLSAEPQKEEPQ